MSGIREIVSRHNPAVKALRAIIEDPRRQGRALLDGIHLVTACLAHGIPLRQLLVSESGKRNPQVVDLLQAATSVECLVLRDGLFRDLSGVSTPTGIAAVIDIPPAAVGRVAADVLMLDAVQDAGNVGAILRTAAAAGVGQVLLGNGCAGAWTPRVLRAGQGAHFSLDIREQVDLAAALGSSPLPSIATVARDGTGLYDLDLAGPAVWLVGNEGAGLSPQLMVAATIRATIPLAAGTESLNVAAAVAICLFEARRQRANLHRK
jgi:TrmH family RNA methyltransferase